MARQRSDKLSQSSRIYTPDHAASDDLQQKYAHTVTPTIMKILPSLGDIKVLSISATVFNYCQNPRFVGLTFKEQ